MILYEFYLKVKKVLFYIEKNMFLLDFKLILFSLIIFFILFFCFSYYLVIKNQNFIKNKFKVLYENNFIFMLMLFLMIFFFIFSIIVLFYILFIVWRCYIFK